MPSSKFEFKQIESQTDLMEIIDGLIVKCSSAYDNIPWKVHLKMNDILVQYLVES